MLVEGKKLSKRGKAVEGGNVDGRLLEGISKLFFPTFGLLVLSVRQTICHQSLHHTTTSTRLIHKSI